MTLMSTEWHFLSDYMSGVEDSSRGKAGKLQTIIIHNITSSLNNRNIITLM